jgi:hypothetical protein
MISKDLNKKAKNAMYIVAVLNVVTAIMFWFAYSNSKENLYLIAAIVNAISSGVILILSKILMNKGAK